MLKKKETSEIREEIEYFRHLLQELLLFLFKNYVFVLKQKHL